MNEYLANLYGMTKTASDAGVEVDPEVAALQNMSALDLLLALQGEEEETEKVASEYFDMGRLMAQGFHAEMSKVAGAEEFEVDLDDLSASDIIALHDAGYVIEKTAAAPTMGAVLKGITGRARGDIGSGYGWAKGLGGAALGRAEGIASDASRYALMGDLVEALGKKGRGRNSRMAAFGHALAGNSGRDVQTQAGIAALLGGGAAAGGAVAGYKNRNKIRAKIKKMVG